MKRWMVAVLVVLVLVAASGCRRVRIEDTETAGRDSASIALGDARGAEVELKFGAGTLLVGSKTDSDTLMTGTFETVPERLLPEMDYEVADGVGRLSVTQPPVSAFSAPGYRNEWDLRLAEGVPMRLDVEAGAGECTLELGGLDLSELSVSAGAGEFTVDLTGDWTHDLDAEISGGVGEMTLRVPRDVGVRVRSQSGIGSVSAEGLRIDGGAYVNEAYGTSPVTLDIDLQQGVGEVRLVVAD